MVERDSYQNTLWKSGTLVRDTQNLPGRLATQLWSSVKSQNVGLFVKKVLRILRLWQQSIKPLWTPYRCRALRNCTGCTPVRWPRIPRRKISGIRTNISPLSISLSCDWDCYFVKDIEAIRRELPHFSNPQLPAYFPLFLNFALSCSVTDLSWLLSKLQFVCWIPYKLAQLRIFSFIYCLSPVSWVFAFLLIPSGCKYYHHIW